MFGSIFAEKEMLDGSVWKTKVSPDVPTKFY